MKNLIIAMLFGLLMATSASSQIVVTAPDTVVWGDSICVDVTVPAQYQFVQIMWFNGYPPITLTGGATHHLCSIFEGTYECYGTNTWSFYFVDPSNVFVQTVYFSIFIDRPWHIVSQAIGVTSAVFDFTTSKPVHMRISLPNSTVMIDSIDILPPGGMWTIMGLNPQTYYYVNAISANWVGQTFSWCRDDIAFTTNICGVATLPHMAVINNGNDLELTLQFPNWLEGSIVWVNGTATLLSPTGTNGPWLTMNVIIPYAPTVTIISPCGDVYSYNTLATGIEPTVSTSIRVTSTSISTEDQATLIEIWSMNGQLLRTGNDKVELNGISSGIYFYRIYDAGGTILSTGKFPKL